MQHRLASRPRVLLGVALLLASSSVRASDSLTDAISAAAESAREWITDTRRALHRIPELGSTEHKTSALIKSKLDELGIPYQ